MSLFKEKFWIIINLALTLPFNYASALAPEGVNPSATPECSEGICNPLASKTFAELISAIANIVMMIGFPVAVMFIIYAGFLFVTARGSEEKITTARKTFTWALVGTAILLGAEILAKAVVATVEGLKN